MANNAVQRRATSDSATREHLILAAEKLIAEDGVYGASMRRISAEAGQKNVSAIHYYFGSREAMIEAVFAYRMAQNGPRRQKMNDELDTCGRTHELGAFVRNAILPLSETLLSSAQENHYVRFLAQVQRVTHFDYWMQVPHQHRKPLVQNYVQVMRLLSHLPRPIMHMRCVSQLKQVFYALADLDLVISERHPGLRDELVHFHTADLIDRTSAALQAPVSEQVKATYESLLKLAPRPQETVFGLDIVRERSAFIRS